LTDIEFYRFVSLGKKYNADPFAGEIYAVKYGDNPASVFLGRNFFRKKAQSHPQYKFHIFARVYENDEFEDPIDANGKVTISHKPARKSERGVLESGYCLVFRKDIENPFYIKVDVDDCNKDMKGNPKGAFWKSAPGVMVEKVAEQRDLKLAFSGDFGDIYGQDEQPIVEAIAMAEDLPEENPYPEAPPALNETQEPPVTPSEVQEKEKVGKQGKLL
jgi:RecT family.